MPGLLKPTLAVLLLLLPLRSVADSESDVRDAVTLLARNSYGWETTVRQRFNGETTEPRVNLNAPIEVRGKVDPKSFTEITQMPSRELDAPVTAVFRFDDVVESPAPSHPADSPPAAACR